MLWALASSAFVMYLYHTLNAESADYTPHAPPNSAEAELAALNARIAALERKLGR
jgi:hypothetical protein